jgi:phage terminase small subunit
MAQPKRRNSKAVTEFTTGGSQVVGTQNPDNPMTEMQRKFVHHLVHDKMSQTIAAREAGYKGHGVAACELMRNPKVRAGIAREREEYARASGMTKQKVIDGFAEAIDLARIKADPVAMIAGWREIGKMCGFYEPTKAEIRVSVDGQVMLHRLNSMSDEELLRLTEDDPTALEGEFSVIDR